MRIPNDEYTRSRKDISFVKYTEHKRGAAPAFPRIWTLLILPAASDYLGNMGRYPKILLPLYFCFDLRETLNIIQVASEGKFGAA